jgi:hypothetical protein
MEHKIKALADAITHVHTRSLIQTHVRDMVFNEETRHLVIYVDNAAPMHELQTDEGDHHLNSGLSEIYGDDITYEVKIHHDAKNERNKNVPHTLKDRKFTK